MNRSRKLCALVLLALTCMVALAPSAGAEVEGASLGPVAASLSYELVTHVYEGYESHEAFNLQLTIERGGQQAYSAAVTSRLPNCSESCWPLSVAGLTTESVQVADLESNGEPDVLLHLWSRGAHCCFIDQFFSWNPATSSYGHTERSWGDLRARVADLGHNGQLELLTADDRFAYTFESYAGSGFPVQVFIFRGGGFIDVTRSYPTRIAADASDQFRRYRARVHQAAGLGFLAAWVADEYLLGRRAQAVRTLQRENRLGNLREHRTLEGPPKNVGGAFIAKLKRFLRATGYG
jgi:hypothetical protein